MTWRSGISAPIAAAATVVLSASVAQAAVVTNLVDLHFSSPSLSSAVTTGTYTSPYSSETYSEAGATYPTNPLLVGYNSSFPSFSGNGMTNTSVDTGMDIPMGAYASDNATATNIVYEAEITPGTETGTQIILNWQTGNTTTSMTLYLSGGDLDASFKAAPSGYGSVSTSTPLTAGVQTHVALVYTYYNGVTDGALSLYTINDNTGVGTQVASTSFATSAATGTLGSLGVLNDPNTYTAAPTRGFNGSIEGALVGTFTGTFVPDDSSYYDPNYGAYGNFQLVPEPASLGILAFIGSTALLRRRRRGMRDDRSVSNLFG